MKKTLMAAALAMALAACSSMAPVVPQAAAPLKKADMDRLVAARPEAARGGFTEFLAQAASETPSLRPAVAAYAAKAPLAGDDLAQIARLLGLYNRLRNQAAVIDATAKMVAIPTVRSGNVPPHEDPNTIAFGTLVEGMARDFGLQYRNVDNRIFEVKLSGSGTEEFGILTHADVVPVVADEWVLDDGTRLDPFKLTRVGGSLYGRGSIDDKGSIATVLYAMKAVKDSGLPLSFT
ncbi:MAG: M20/M25/M40 family metallo-hydrolase, partial [Burkholderiaceae bacterium]